VTIEGFRSAVAGASPAALLPDRSQARAASLTGDITVLDILDLGSDAKGRPAAVAVVRVAGRDLIAPGVVADGVFHRDPGVASLLVPGTRGAFEVELIGSGVPTADAVPLDVDQSNDSVVIGDVMVKWQLDAAVSPAPDRLRALVGSGTVPELRAIVTWTHPDGARCTVLTAAEALPDAEDGWTWAVEQVRAHARGDDVDALTPFALIGSMTARMHAALSRTGGAVWGRDDIARLHTECCERLAEAADTVGGPEGERLRARKARIRHVLDGLLDVDETPVIDIHGDLHVGQVLRSPRAEGDSVLAFVDFDGNPLLSAEERCARQPAARDVAGMLASIDHVARVVNHHTPDLDPERARAWIPVAQREFLDAYRAELDARGCAGLLDERLLPAMMVDQELREYRYAVQYLPHWTYVPDAVITDLLPDDATEQES